MIEESVEMLTIVIVVSISCCCLCPSIDDQLRHSDETALLSFFFAVLFDGRGQIRTAAAAAADCPGWLQQRTRSALKMCTFFKILNHEKMEFLILG